MAEDKKVDKKRAWDGSAPPPPNRFPPEETLTANAGEYDVPVIVPGKEAD